MKQKQLIREYYELCDGGVCEDLLTEDEKRRIRDEGACILSGVMQMAETKNGNGRMYPQKVLEREVKNYAKLVSENRALGELDHPETAVVSLNEVSHRVTKIWMEGNTCNGKIEVLSTPKGKILKELIKAGVKLGISSRGTGSTRNENGVTIVEDDFQLICFDMVSDPSTPGAFMMTEAREPTNVFTKGDKINRALNDILSKYEK